MKQKETLERDRDKKLRENEKVKREMEKAMNKLQDQNSELMLQRSELTLQLDEKEHENQKELDRYDDKLKDMNAQKEQLEAQVIK